VNLPGTYFALAFALDERLTNPLNPTLFVVAHESSQSGQKIGQRGRV